MLRPQWIVGSSLLLPSAPRSGRQREGRHANTTENKRWAGPPNRTQPDNESHSETKIHKLPSQDITWRKHQCKWMSGRSQVDKATYRMMPTTWDSRKDKTMQTVKGLVILENRFVIAKKEEGWGGMHWEFGINKCKLVYTCITELFALYQKLTQHCKSAILQ